MIPQPLHPAVVHFPIVLVVLLPLVALTALLLIRRGEEARKMWVPVTVLALALAGSAWLAVETGEKEEDVVEEVVAESAIHEHEEAAELFLPLSAGVLLLVGAGLLNGGPGRIARYVGTVAAIGLVVVGVNVGHTGGELVYEHGAASAYTSGGGRSQRERTSERDRDARREAAEESDRGERH